MAPTAGSPVTWTLRLKHHKSTILLHVDPLQSFQSVKTELIRALQHTHPDGRLQGTIDIPSDVIDVLLAKPNDIYDHSKGWTLIQTSDDAEQQDEGLKERAQKKSKTRPGFPDSCPKAAGLKEGSVLAFKFRNDNDEDEGLGLDEEDWDVIVPTYEDSTGVTNQGDVGGHQNFTG